MSVQVPTGDLRKYQPGHKEVIGRNVAGRYGKENCRWLRP